MSTVLNNYRVRKVCNHCGKKYDLTRRAKEDALKLPANRRIYGRCDSDSCQQVR